MSRASSAWRRASSACRRGRFSFLFRVLGILALALASYPASLRRLVGRLVGALPLGAILARHFRDATLLFRDPPAALGVSFGVPCRLANRLTCGFASRR